MEGQISVELLGHELRAFLPLDRPGNNKIRLTTSNDLQHSGRIRIFLVRHDNMLLKEFIVRDIPLLKAGEPDIDILGEYTAEGLLYLKLLVNGRERTAFEIDLKSYRESKSKTPMILLPLIILLLFAVILFTILFKPVKLFQGVFNRPPETEISPAAETISLKPETSMAYQEKSLTVYFLPDNAVLTPAAKDNLNKIMSRLTEEPEPDHLVSITGHCALYGSEAGREKLSLERAENAAEFLRQRGWKPEIEPAVKGLGGKEPVTRNRYKQQQNRRVEIIY